MDVSDIQNTAATYALKKALEIPGQLIEILPETPEALTAPAQQVSMADVTGKGSLINVMG